jgi:hypothetical protein
MEQTMDRHGWNSLGDFRGIRRERIVAHSRIRRPGARPYFGGHEEGYAPADAAVSVEGRG